MFQYIKGILASKTENSIVVETGGIGYILYVAGNSAFYLKDEGSEVKVYTTMIVREDDVSIYGFADIEEREIFAKLRTVSGVGAKAAISVLSAMPLHELKKSIIYGDAKSIQRANGVGKKTAERIVLELKDKMGSADELQDENTEAGNTVPVKHSDERSAAVDALIALGYSRNEALTGVAAVKDEGLTVEEYIKGALKEMF